MAANYLDHAYEFILPDAGGQEIAGWFVPVEGTRLASHNVEVVRMLRAKKIIALGMCAGLLSHMRRGEFAMPVEVLPNDTGQRYNAGLPGDRYTHPDPYLDASLRRRLLRHDPAAKVWRVRGITDEAMMRQTRAVANEWAADGYGTVDMETGLLLGAASHPRLFGRPAAAAALLYIVDNPRLGTVPSESGHLLTVNDARTLQYRVALEEIRGVAG